MRVMRSCPWGARTGCLLLILTGLAAAPAGAQVSLGIGPLESAGAYRDAVGVPKTFVCPASDGSKANVYGTDIYTDSSPICAAAIHAGVLKPGAAGAVTLVMGSGAEAYKGSERNGVRALSYERWGHSYSFVKEPVAGTITWRTVWKYLPKEFAGPVELVCPPGDPASSPVWGTDVYTTESSLCVAAVHAGVIGAKEGGAITIVRAPGQGVYAGSDRNGVASRTAGGSPDAFTVSGGALAGAGPAPDGTATLEPAADSTLPTFGTTTTTAITPTQPASPPPAAPPPGQTPAEPPEDPPLTAGTPPPVPTCTSPVGTPAVCVTLAGWSGTGAGYVPPPPVPADPAMAPAPVPPLTITLPGWAGEGAGYVAPPPADPAMAPAPGVPLTITLPGWTGEGAGYVEETNDEDEN